MISAERNRDLSVTGRAAAWRERYRCALWRRSNSTWPWFLQLFWIIFLSCFLYPILLSGLVLNTPPLPLSLWCFQVLTSYWPVWDLQRLRPYKSGCCDYFGAQSSFPWGPEELCQQMWFVHSAQAAGGTNWGVWTPRGIGDPPALPEARGCGRCRCTGASAAAVREGRCVWLQGQNLSRGW